MKEFWDVVAPVVFVFALLFVLLSIGVAVDVWRLSRDPRARNIDGQPANEDRCPWLCWGNREQCRRWKGHKGLCAIAVPHTNIQTGRVEYSFQDYYGINYQHPEDM